MQRETRTAWDNSLVDCHRATRMIGTASTNTRTLKRRIVSARSMMVMFFRTGQDRTKVAACEGYPVTVLACARPFAHRFFAALAIFALPAADSTRFFVRFSSRPVESPKAFAAAR